MAISPYVVIWSVLAILGLALTIPMLVAALRDNANVRHSDDVTAEQRIANRAALRNAVGRVIINVAFLVVGVVTAANETDPPVPHFSAVFALDLIVALLVLDILSVIDWTQRHQIIHAGDTKREALARVAAIAAQSHQEMMAAIQENTAITRMADKHATDAYHEANTVNQKIADANQNVARLVKVHSEQGAVHTAQLDTMSKTETDTNERVQDVQRKIEPQGDSE